MTKQKKVRLVFSPYILTCNLPKVHAQFVDENNIIITWRMLLANLIIFLLFLVILSALLAVPLSLAIYFL